MAAQTYYAVSMDGRGSLTKFAKCGSERKQFHAIVIERILDRTYYNVPVDSSRSTHTASKNPPQQLGDRCAPYFLTRFVGFMR